MTPRSRKPTLNLLGKKKSSLPKPESQKIHFKQRFFERVGYILTDEKYDQILKAVKINGKFLHRQEGSNASVYDAFKGNLVTILPNNEK